MIERSPPESVVFVIDDDASVRDSLKNLLESVGLQAELFDSAQAKTETSKQTELMHLFMSSTPPVQAR